MKIRDRLLAYLLLLTLVPLLLLGGTMLRLYEAARSQHEDHELLVQANEMATGVEVFARSNLEALRANSTLPVFARYLAAGRTRGEHAAEALDTLRALLATDPVFVVSAALYDAQGTRLLDTAQEHSADSPARLMLYRESLSLGLPRLLGPFYPAQAASGELDLVQPVRNAAGQSIGLLRLRFASSRLLPFVQRPQGLARPGSLALLLDNDGVVLAHGSEPTRQGRAVFGHADIATLQAQSRLASAQPEQIAGHWPALHDGHGIAWLPNEQAAQQRIAVVSLRTLPWRVAVIQQAAAYAASVTTLRRGVVAVGLALGLLLVIVAWRVARSLARPISELTEAAEHLSSSEVDVALPLAAGGEVGRLARTLQRTGTRLRHSLAELEARVATERAVSQRLQASEAHFAALFHRSPLPMMLSGRDDETVKRCNAAFTAAFALSTAHSLAEAATTDWAWIAEAALREEIRARLGADADVDLVAPLNCRDGQRRPHRLFARVFVSASETLVVWTCVDVTEAEHARHALEELNAGLEDRVRLRTDELQTALERLQQTQNELVRADKLAALGGLVAGVAHELNTPIGNAVTMASTVQELSRSLARDIKGGQLRRSALLNYVETLHEAADLLGRNLERTHSLVANFKQVAVDRVSEVRRRFDLAQVLEEVAGTMTPMLRKAEVTVRFELQPGLVMDSYPGPIGQVLTNFITNALAHAFAAGHGGELCIRARAEGSKHVSFECEDNGLGMTAEQERRAFDPFFTTRLGSGGSGLGLHIVYNLVTGLLGGSVNLRTQLGVGSCFQVTLPRLAPQGAQAEDEHQALAPTQG